MVVDVDVVHQRLRTRSGTDLYMQPVVVVADWPNSC